MKNLSFLKFYLMEGLKSLWKYGSWKTKAMVLGVLMTGTVPTVVGKNKKTAKVVENSREKVSEEVNQQTDYPLREEDIKRMGEVLALAEPEPEPEPEANPEPEPQPQKKEKSAEILTPEKCLHTFSDEFLDWRSNPPEEIKRVKQMILTMCLKIAHEPQGSLERQRLMHERELFINSHAVQHLITMREALSKRAQEIDNEIEELREDYRNNEMAGDKEAKKLRKKTIPLSKKAARLERNIDELPPYFLEEGAGFCQADNKSSKVIAWEERGGVDIKKCIDEEILSLCILKKDNNEFLYSLTSFDGTTEKDEDGRLKYCLFVNGERLYFLEVYKGELERHEVSIDKKGEVKRDYLYFRGFCGTMTGNE